MLRIRVTPEQYAQMKKDSHKRGYKSFSKYVRTALLQNSYDVEEKINMIFNRVVMDYDRRF